MRLKHHTRHSQTSCSPHPCTRAVWWTNLICFLAHTTMIFVTLHMAYWRWGLSMWHDTEHMQVRIFRISQIPTVEVYMNNMSVWSPGYNGTDAAHLGDNNARDIGGNEHWLHDNDMAVNFASLTISFFAISAVFHLWALLVGIFERTWFLYWRCATAPFKTRPLTRNNQDSHVCVRDSQSARRCFSILEMARVFGKCFGDGHGHCHFHWPARAVHSRGHFHVRNHAIQPHPQNQLLHCALLTTNASVCLAGFTGRPW